MPIDFKKQAEQLEKFLSHETEKRMTDLAMWQQVILRLCDQDVALNETGRERMESAARAIMWMQKRFIAERAVKSGPAGTGKTGMLTDKLLLSGVHKIECGACGETAAAIAPDTTRRPGAGFYVRCGACDTCGCIEDTRIGALDLWRRFFYGQVHGKPAEVFTGSPEQPERSIDRLVEQDKMMDEIFEPDALKNEDRVTDEMLAGQHTVYCPWCKKHIASVGNHGAGFSVYCPKCCRCPCGMSGRAGPTRPTRLEALAAWREFPGYLMGET